MLEDPSMDGHRGIGDLFQDNTAVKCSKNQCLNCDLLYTISHLYTAVLLRQYYTVVILCPNCVSFGLPSKILIFVFRNLLAFIQS